MNIVFVDKVVVALCQVVLAVVLLTISTTRAFYLDPFGFGGGFGGFGGFGGGFGGLGGYG